jgi:phenylalanine-4-hydroxylase
LKIYGAGILAGIEEMVYSMTSGIPVIKPFNVSEVVETEYPFTVHQPLYFFVDSFDHAKRLMRKFVSETMAKKFTLQNTTKEDGSVCLKPKEDIEFI